MKDLTRENRVCFEVDSPLAYVKTTGIPCQADYLSARIKRKKRDRKKNSKNTKMKQIKKILHFRNYHQPVEILGLKHNILK